MLVLLKLENKFTRVISQLNLISKHHEKYKFLLELTFYLSKNAHQLVIHIQRDRRSCSYQLDSDIFDRSCWLNRIHLCLQNENSSYIVNVTFSCRYLICATIKVELIMNELFQAE